MVLRASSLLKLLPLLCFTTALSSAQSIPAIKAKALDNSEIVLPDPGSRQFLILILGFSQKGGKLCQVWSKKISADYHADTRIAYFSLPVLQSAPSLVRPIIVYGMRKGVPAQELRHFVPLYSNEPDWTKLVNFSTPDDAYLLLQRPTAISSGGLRALSLTPSTLTSKNPSLPSKNPPLLIKKPYGESGALRRPRAQPGTTLDRQVARKVDSGSLPSKKLAHFGSSARGSRVGLYSQTVENQPQSALMLV